METSDAAKFFKRLGVTLLVLLVIAVPLGLVGPTKPDTGGYEDARAEALAVADLNESRAEGAPQQAVVNGWLARDLALIDISQQNDQLALLHFIAALLVAVVLAVAIAGFGLARARQPASPPPAPPGSGAPAWPGI